MNFPQNILKIYNQLIGIQLDLNLHLHLIVHYLGELNLELWIYRLLMRKMLY